MTTKNPRPFRLGWIRARRTKAALPREGRDSPSSGSRQWPAMADQAIEQSGFSRRSKALRSAAQIDQGERMSALALEGYYVYVFRDLEGAPRYVGKGMGRRYADRSPYAHNGAVHLLLKSKKHAPVEIVASGLTEEEAYELEAGTIVRFGRQLDGGTLFNAARGGRWPSAYAKYRCCKPDVTGGSYEIGRRGVAQAE